MNDEKQYFTYKINIIDALGQKGINFYTCRKSGLFSQGTLTHLRNGENISLNTAAKIANILGVSLSDLFDVTDGNQT